ncbi:MAG: FkbM family methyltransferase [Pseudomonadota bacterium]
MDDVDGAPPYSLDKAQCVRSRGMFFPKHPDIIRGNVRLSLRRHAYEHYESEAALKVVRAGDIVLELGGGIGYMSTLVATKQAIDHVHVFEANPRLIPYIHDVHKVNKVTNATVHNAILGARKGKAKFHVRKNFLASSLSEIKGRPAIAIEDIDVVNARATIKSIAPTVLICDIEGAEVDVIPRLDLSSVRVAIVETHPQWIGPKGINTVFQAFMDAGLAYSHRGSVRKVVCFRRDWPLK